MSSPGGIDEGGTPVRSMPGLRMLRARRSAAAPFRGAWRLWRRSLQLRTVAISVVLSSLGLLAVGTYVSFTIGQGLFTDRLNQVLQESARATTAAQTVFGSSTATDAQSLEVVRLNAVDSLQGVATGLTDFAIDRSPGPTGAVVLSDIFSHPVINGLVTNDLRTAVQKADSGLQWQSVGIPTASGVPHPAIMVGSVLEIPSAGPSELYLLYDIDDVQTTLDFVQRTLLIGGAVLVLLIGLVTLLVVRLIVVPIREAAEVSEELAAGRLERRIPERGDDVVATLARSFNRMADGLQRQITQLANLSRVQQRFVSDVSHELRTPLTTIRLASDVLYNDRDRFDTHTARSAELLRAQVERFEALLADLLEISRMDAQAADLAGEPTSLVALARETIDALGNLAEDTGTEVRLVTPGGHVEIEVDARRIARIVRNLLANAIEHGEGRPIVVTVDSSATAVSLGVRDHGVGMTPAQATRVFDRFWRADPSRQRRTGGTGLGLAISLEDAQLHGGVLEVWSAPGAGANFVLTLPRVHGAPAGASPIPRVPADAAVGAMAAPPSDSRARRRIRRPKARL